MLANSPVASVRVALVAKHTRLGRARNNSFQRTACETIHRKLGGTGDMLLRPCCRFELRVPKSVVKHTVASVRGVGKAFRRPRTSRSSVVILGNDTPMSVVQSCRARMASCAGKQNELFYSLGNCTPYRGRSRVMRRVKCSSRHSLSGPANSMFYTRKTKFIIP